MLVLSKRVLRAFVLVMIMTACPSLSFAEEQIEGKLVANVIGKISSQTTGERSVRVEEVLVRKGDRVKKGELLARLSVQQLKADRLVAQRIL